MNHRLEREHWREQRREHWRVVREQRLRWRALTPRRMQRQIFVGFGLSILATMLLSVAVFGLFHAPHGAWPWMRSLALFVAGSVVWTLSGVVARRMAWPMRELARVATELGAGKLESRVRLPQRGPREIGEVAAAFNEMAERIEAQVKSQQELLGAASHELRTPLARLRVLLAILQDAGTDPELIAKIEREIVEMDTLVGELLAGARVEAGALQKRELDAADVVRECVERSGLPADVHVAEDARRVHADATLLSRALTVLLDNARKHGGTRLAVRVQRESDGIAFAVEDDGRGFESEDLPRVFEPFARGRGLLPDEQQGVGLGLYLVRRIAQAHGGRAFADNRAEGGARVGFVIGQAAAPGGVGT
jgi:two-component system OmpR family sensor kinase